MSFLGYTSKILLRRCISKGKLNKYPKMIQTYTGLALQNRLFFFISILAGPDSLGQTAFDISHYLAAGQNLRAAFSYGINDVRYVSFVWVNSLYNFTVKLDIEIIFFKEIKIKNSNILWNIIGKHFSNIQNQTKLLNHLYFNFFS